MNAAAKFPQNINVERYDFPTWIGLAQGGNGGGIRLRVAKFSDEQRTVADIVVHVGGGKVATAGAVRATGFLV